MNEPGGGAPDPGCWGPPAAGPSRTGRGRAGLGRAGPAAGRRMRRPGTGTGRAARCSRGAGTGRAVRCWSALEPGTSRAAVRRARAAPAPRAAAPAGAGRARVGRAGAGRTQAALAGAGRTEAAPAGAGRAEDPTGTAGPGGLAGAARRTSRVGVAADSRPAAARPAPGPGTTPGLGTTPGPAGPAEGWPLTATARPSQRAARCPAADSRMVNRLPGPARRRPALNQGPVHQCFVPLPQSPALPGEEVPHSQCRRLFTMPFPGSQNPSSLPMAPRNYQRTYHCTPVPYGTQT